jgi:hypothetical protein
MEGKTIKKKGTETGYRDFMAQIGCYDKRI